MVDVTLTGFNGEVVDVWRMPYEDTPPLWIKRPVLAGPISAVMLATLGFCDEDDDVPSMPMGIGEPPLTFHEETYVYIGDHVYRRTR